MSSVQHLREFISERLTAAAEEIFTEFEKTIVQYEEVIDRQRRLLDVSWKPQINFHPADLPQQHDYEKEDILSDQQLFQQEMKSSLDQEEPETQQTEEEQDEVHISQEGEQLVLKDETDMVVQCKSESEEMFYSVEKTTIQYEEEEAEHQPRLWNIIMKPQVKLQGIDISQQHFCKEKEEVLNNQRLCSQVKNSRLDQDELEPAQVKEEQEQQSTNQEGDQLVLNQDTNPFIATSNDEESNHIKKEPNSNQLFFHNSFLAEHHVQETDKFVFSGSAINTEQMMSSINRSHNNVGNSSRPNSYRGNEKQSKKTVACDICGKVCHSMSLMKQHRYVHTGEKPYLCKICGKSYRQSSNLTVHIRTHTGEKPYSCGTCGKGFTGRGSLTVHMRTHTGERPYSCKTCGKRFSLSSHLTDHMRTHTGERPYSCKLCGKSFSQKGTLIGHMRTHTVEKPHSCKTCGKSFRESGALTSHMRTHTGEKPYCCKTCGKGFSESGTLTSHMRTHTGEKPYSCETCGKSFSRRYGLNVHMKTHTAGKPYSCMWDKLQQKEVFD
ncbi:zinc finger protein 568-like isoform X2 [Melanotaenia boesemani]|uniref:zinc finger protein 568-like isoform X2 n=1 Tax=Melanotaenia boesemani TaxID=1250792 RepID=UPI001C058F66|nr:zinc finger protein 568-like isoform X2 [Melanotaenia boesemani]